MMQKETRKETQRETSTYRIFLTVRADYADTSYWTTDGYTSRCIDRNPLPFEKVVPTVTDYLPRTLALIAKAARTDPVKYEVSGIIRAYYADGREALRYLEVKAASAEKIQELARSSTEKYMKELAKIGADEVVLHAV